MFRMIQTVEKAKINKLIVQEFQKSVEIFLKKNFDRFVLGC